MISVLDMTVTDLKAAIADLKQPAYRADQLADWVFKKGVTDPAAMTNLPPALREQVTVMTSHVVARTDSEDGTIKLLLEYTDGAKVECVLIPTETRATACLSTQVGCAIGCAFCASGMEGMVRNLTSGEILQQVLHLQQALTEQASEFRRVTHAVFMGMGEPLLNYENTLSAVRAIIDPARLGVSARHVTISTVGIPRAIRRLAGEDLPITLAISLHAPNDVLRKQLIPLAERYTIEEILAAARQFFDARGREVTLEYVLLGGVNDTPVCAEGLAKLARGLRCNINLIRYNPVPSLQFVRPSQAAVQDFLRRLERAGVNVHMRKSRGADAAAACGQLKRNSFTTEAAEKTENDSEDPEADIEE